MPEMIRLCQALGLLSVLIFNGVELVNSEEPVSVRLNKNNPFSAVRDATYTCGQKAIVHCHIKNEVVGSKFVQLVLYTQSGSTILTSEKTDNDQNHYYDLQAEVTSGGLYSCQHDNKGYLTFKSHTFNITIIVQGSGSTCTSNTPTTTSTTRPTAATTSPTASNHDHHYGALNIIIYTIVSIVFLGVFLGVLMLISIITCWVKSRKNTQLRALLPQDAPEDYLECIQQERQIRLKKRTERMDPMLRSVYNNNRQETQRLQYTDTEKTNDFQHYK